MDNRISINKIIADIKATKGNRSGCQGLSSSLESDGYITSICKWARATSPGRIDALLEHVEKQDAALIAWEKTMMDVCGEDGPASVASEIRALQALRDTAMQALKSQVDQLAAENVVLKGAFEKPQAYLSWHSIPPTWEDPLPCGEYLDVHDTAGHKNSDGTDCWPVFAKPEIETPATDRIVAGIKADGLLQYAENLDSAADDAERNGYDDAVKFLRSEASAVCLFASQLRKGADKC